MDFEKVEVFLSLDYYLRPGDYVYEHEQEGEPRKDMGTLYVVTKSDRHQLTICSSPQNEERSIDLKKVIGYWWVCRLDPLTRKKLNME